MIIIKNFKNFSGLKKLLGIMYDRENNSTVLVYGIALYFKNKLLKEVESLMKL